MKEVYFWILLKKNWQRAVTLKPNLLLKIFTPTLIFSKPYPRSNFGVQPFQGTPQITDYAANGSICVFMLVINTQTYCK